MRDVSISLDVEWAHDDVVADVVQLLDERAIRATFFCTHGGIDLPGHERGLHPNFRRRGNSALADAPASLLADDIGVYRHVLAHAHAHCKEAIGVRAHSLFADSDLLPVYRAAGLEYDSSYMLPLAPGLSPVCRGHDIVELPLYFMDHWDLAAQATGFTREGLKLHQSGLKVLAFHPNLICLNAASTDDYELSRPHYHDPDWLMSHRRSGRGVRTLFLEVIDWLAGRERPLVLAEVNTRWRSAHASV